MLTAHPHEGIKHTGKARVCSPDISESDRGEAEVSVALSRKIVAIITTITEYIVVQLEHRSRGPFVPKAIMDDGNNKQSED